MFSLCLLSVFRETRAMVRGQMLVAVVVLVVAVLVGVVNINHVLICLTQSLSLAPSRFRQPP